MSTTTRAPRVLAPDLARGVMLLLIAMAYAGVYAGAGFGTDVSSASWPDRAAAFATTVFLDNRAFPMFAILFDAQSSPLLNVAACDRAFSGTAMNGGSCAATSGQSATEQLHLFGPASSTDPATTFTHTVTWAAFP